MSQTTCTHCGSTNSIETAGQRYCADCGQLISGNKSEDKVAKKPQAKTVTQQAPSAKPDTKQKSKPRKTAPPLNLKAIEESRSTAKASHTVNGALDLRNATPKPPTKKPIGKHVAPKPQQQIAAAKPVAEPVVAEAPIAEVRIPVPSKTFRHKLALRESLKAVFKGRALSTALLAILVGMACQTIVAIIFAKTGLFAITESLRVGSVNVARATTLIDHVAWMVLAGLLGYVVYQYALAKIVYQGSTEYDRLNSSASHVRRIALGSLFGLTSLDLITFITSTLILLAATGANLGFLGTKSLGVAGVVLAALVNGIAVYVLLGLVVARQMAIYVVVMGQVRLRRAYATGWALYTRQFGRTTSGILLMILISAVIATPAAVLLGLMGVTSLLTLAVVVAVTAVTQAVIMVVAALYFARLYQFVIVHEYDSELGHLLSGRQPQKAHIGRRMAALVIVLLIIAAAMVSLIMSSTPVATIIIR